MVVQHSVWEGPLSAMQVASQIRQILLGSQGKSASNEALWSEAIRTAVWLLNATNQQGRIPDTGASTKQVLIQVRQLLKPLHAENKPHAQNGTSATDEEQIQDSERDRLEALEEQGDLFSLPGGYWLPAPPRLVPLTDAQYLLVGGIPISVLPELQPHLHLHGCFRHIQLTTPTPQFLSSWQFQSLQNWLGPTPSTLQQMIDDFRAYSLQPVSLQESVSRTIEVYIGQVNKPQARRWQTLDRVNSGRYLLRTQLPWGKRQYSIGRVQNHFLTEQSETLQFTDIRRLCYTLDYHSNTPTTVEWDSTRGKLTLHSELPIYERKYLASIAVLYLPQEQYYPRTWINIIQQHHKTIEKMLHNLGIKVTR